MATRARSDERNVRDFEPTEEDWAAVAELLREPPDAEIFAMLERLYDERVAAGLEAGKTAALLAPGLRR